MFLGHFVREGVKIVREVVKIVSEGVKIVRKGVKIVRKVFPPPRRAARIRNTDIDYKARFFDHLDHFARNYERFFRFDLW